MTSTDATRVPRSPRRGTIPSRRGGGWSAGHRSAIAAALAAICHAASGHPLPTPPSAPSVEQLKRVYLQCDRLASQRVPDRLTMAHCSVVSEQLLKAGFDGDLDRLLAWWRDARDAAAPDGSEVAARANLR